MSEGSGLRCAQLADCFRNLAALILYSSSLLSSSRNFLPFLDWLLLNLDFSQAGLDASTAAFIASGVTGLVLIAMVSRSPVSAQSKLTG